MAKYEDFLKIIHDYKEKEVTEPKIESISLAEILEILHLEMDDLFSISESGERIKKLSDKINSEINSMIPKQEIIEPEESVSKFKSLLNNRIKVDVKTKNLESKYYFLNGWHVSEIKTVYDDSSVGIDVVFYFSSSHSVKMSVYKDINSDAMYFKKNNFTGQTLEDSRNLVKELLDDFFEILQILESYLNFFDNGLYNEKSTIKEKLTDGFFEVELIISSDGSISTLFRINPEIDKEDIFNRDYINMDSLYKIFFDNQGSIIKKIYIPLNSIKNEKIINMINKHREKNKTLGLNQVQV